MNYYFPTVNASAWLLQVLDLFDSVISSIWNFPILRFFVVLLLVAAVWGLFVCLSKVPGK